MVEFQENVQSNNAVSSICFSPEILCTRDIFLRSEMDIAVSESHIISIELLMGLPPLIIIRTFFDLPSLPNSDLIVFCLTGRLFPFYEAVSMLMRF